MYFTWIDKAFPIRILEILEKHFTIQYSVSYRARQPIQKNRNHPAKKCSIVNKNGYKLTGPAKGDRDKERPQRREAALRLPGLPLAYLRPHYAMFGRLCTALRPFTQGLLNVALFVTSKRFGLKLTYKRECNIRPFIVGKAENVVIKQLSGPEDQIVRTTWPAAPWTRFSRPWREVGRGRSQIRPACSVDPDTVSRWWRGLRRPGELWGHIPILDSFLTSNFSHINR
ncbi:hypothetical protein J6590_035277 [Homalodisca vitripennis]|nr:hypothetical protein J6590_035277 [Homalodisca vitripennis]